MLLPDAACKNGNRFGAQPDDYIFFDERGKPIRQEKFGEKHFQGASP